MKVVFDDKAISDLQAIREWIEQDSPAMADKVIDRILLAARSLEVFPRRGRPGQHPATYEFVVPRLPYLLIYQIRASVRELAVTSVVHMARDRSSSDV